MASPNHRLTREQVAAGTRLRPALILAPTGDGVTLSSNGVPVWYDDDGRDHAAPAWTWWHPATGRRGTDDRPPDTQRFLPLSHRYRDGP